MAEELAETTTKEADATPQKTVKRWLLEIKLALKREKEWREKAEKVLLTYRGTDAKKNSFNILWANTEVMRPALYNSTPKPDVRRRFRQEDKLGKAVSEVMERGLSYCVDAYDMDNCLQNDTLDSLLPGRGLSRVRYVPIYKAKAGTTPDPEDPKQLEADEAPHEGEAFEGDREEVEYEQALCEHVQWDDFIHGPGKTWEEVQWTGFRAKLTKDDLIEKFGKARADKIKLGDVLDDELKEGGANDDIKEVFQRAELWEIWDRESGKVFFINDSYKESPLYPVDGENDTNGEPPIKFKNFFPCPRPLMLVEDTGTLIPEPLYELYREQAQELDRISGRINKIINACRVRFVYDSTVTELQTLTEAGDNDGIPSESARAFAMSGGLDKAIWWMPVEQIAKVLKELYVARDTCKQVIYEITGISDILRGATDPNETLGAQKLKANSSSLRLQRMQREVQRYSRDLIRLLAEVIGEEFSVPTLAKMTGLNFPDAMQKQQAQLMAQAMQQNPQAVPPDKQQQLQQMLAMPTWEEIKAAMSSDMEREYRVDVETDSTVAQSLQQDMEGLTEVIGGIVKFWQGVGPAVQAGAVSIDAVKAITMVIARRANMGLEVEDALENGMQNPKPQNDPGQAQAQQAAQEAQQKAQLEQQKQASEQQAEAARLEHEKQIAAREAATEQQRAQYEAQLEQQRTAFEAQLQEQQAQREDAFNRWKVEQDNKTKIEVAEISAQATLDKAQVDAANAAEQETNAALSDGGQAGEAAQAKTKKRAAPIDKLAAMHEQTMASHGATLDAIKGLADVMSRPRKRVIERGPDGRAAGMTESLQ